MLSLIQWNYKRPAILICPGGVYLGCSDREAEPVALRFTAMGYHTFVLHCSVYFQGKQGSSEQYEKREVKEHCIHPNPMRGIGKTMLLIRENADTWKVDINQIVLCGFSAGAHNCAMYFVNWHMPVICSFFNQNPDFFRAAATILGYILSNYLLMREFSQEKTNKDLFELSNIALTGRANPDNETLKKISPAFHVKTNTPPMFLWATAEDELVPVKHTLEMATSLANNKIPFEVHVFEKGKHGLSLAEQTSSANIADKQ